MRNGSSGSNPEARRPLIISPLWGVERTPTLRISAYRQKAVVGERRTELPVIAKRRHADHRPAIANLMEINALPRVLPYRRLES